jgi:hypothetical protein
MKKNIPEASTRTEEKIMKLALSAKVSGSWSIRSRFLGVAVSLTKVFLLL